MSDFSLSIGGRPVENYTLHQVKSGLSQEEVKQTLEAEKDGQDTVGVQIDGVDYLISGQGLTAEIGEEILLDGQAAGQVAFVEQEENTFSEGFSSGVRSAGGMATLGVAVGRGVAAMNKEAQDHVLKQVTEGPPLTREVVQEAVEAITNMFGFGDD